MADPHHRIAIVGAGFIADYHAAGLQATGRATITTLVGRDAERTARRAAELGIAAAATDLHRVLADRDIDAVVIATPDGLHREHAVAALEAGKAVLLQKPMALDADDCEAILAAAKRTGTPLSVSFMHRHFPEVRWLEALLDQGSLGQIDSVRIRNATPGADWAEWFYRPGDVAGGVVMQLGVHGIDLCQHLFGSIDTVQAMLRTARPERTLSDGRRITHALEDNALAHYRLADGLTVTHEMSYTELAGCDRFRLEVYAERGTVWLRSARAPALLHAPAITGRDDWQPITFDDEALGRAHHQHWLATLAGGTDDTALAGLSSIRVAEAIYRAAHDARHVTVAGSSA